MEKLDLYQRLKTEICVSMKLNDPNDVLANVQAILAQSSGGISWNGIVTGRHCLRKRGCGIFTNLSFSLLARAACPF